MDNELVDFTAIVTYKRVEPYDDFYIYTPGIGATTEIITRLNIDNDEQLDLLNQILSTFEFIDQNSNNYIEGQEMQYCKLGLCCCPIGAICD